jgi:hypothetical protein
VMEGRPRAGSTVGLRQLVHQDISPVAHHDED